LKTAGGQTLLAKKKTLTNQVKPARSNRINYSKMINKSTTAIFAKISNIALNHLFVYSVQILKLKQSITNRSSELTTNLHL
jgi:hypothetical protein